MDNFRKHGKHLWRMALLFGCGILAFVALRMLLVPKGFGVLGHYRLGALADNRERPLVHAGRAACADCHDSQVKALASQGHAKLGCETCHGPLARHAAAEDPSKLKPALPEPRSLCLSCHEANVAKPRGFPQQDSRSHHPGTPCTTCHTPHRPRMEAPK
jgi:hypothetical protein